MKLRPAKLPASGELRSCERRGGSRAEGDYGPEPIKAKISDAEHARVHTMLVLGARELENDSVAVRLHGKGNVGVKPCSDAVNDILAAIKERRA